MPAPLPPDEPARLKALHHYAILDSDPEQSYNDIVKIAAAIADAPIAAIALVDHERQWFKAKLGIDADETPRDMAFCAHTILNPDEPLYVEDAFADPRFADNPMVMGEPKIRFYFGVPLTTPQHVALGSLCISDRVPRHLSPEQIASLKALGRLAVMQMELRRKAAELQQVAIDQMIFMEQLKIYQCELMATHQKLNDDSLTDIVTGIGNRAGFDKRLAEEVDRFNRFGSPLSLLFVDIDEFKKIQAASGQAAAESVLKTLANELSCIRPSDFLARYNDDRFAVIMPATTIDQACSLADQIRSAIGAVMTLHGAITVSIGIGTLTNEKLPGYPLVRKTEEALQAAQKAGRNRVIHADLVKELIRENYIII